MFENMLQDWNRGITTDNATNMKAFLEFPCVWLIVFRPQFKFGQEQSLEDPKNLLSEHADTFPSGFYRSWRKKREKKKTLCDALIYDVIKKVGINFCSNRPSVLASEEVHRSTWQFMLKDSDIAALDNVKKLLQPLHDLTGTLASEKWVTRCDAHSHQRGSTSGSEPHWAGGRQHSPEEDEASIDGRLARGEIHTSTSHLPLSGGPI